MSTSKCPVCGNPGVPDYLNSDVVCPHCGSDLSIYRIISDTSKGGAASAGHIRLYKLLSILLPVFVIVAGILLFFRYSGKQEKAYNAQIAEKDLMISALNEKISLLEASAESQISSVSNTIDYVVVKNDGPWGIVNKVFGARKDWVKVYTQIAKDNEIWNSETNTWGLIHPGQILKINRDL